MPVVAKQPINYPLPLADEALQLPWYVARTLPRAEGVAAGGLIARGFRCWLPVERQVRKVGNTNVRRISYRPLIPSYIFASFRLEELDRVRATAGVQRIMSINEKPVGITSEQMRLIREAERNGMKNNGKTAGIRLNKGTQVMIMEHPTFGGLPGTVKWDNGNGTLAVQVGQYRAIVPAKNVREIRLDDPEKRL